ncbi:OB-fold domain-containing protein [Streptomyces sp. NPDC046805]|uniref:Zn-ribbon domain-containing OB-fold protein n=1 Tax=Streptomyces sp. NPDC046805 TaxID=3155134 RepID=UPI0034033E8E
MTPADTAPAQGYADGLAAGELCFQRCADCEQAVFYPRLLCPHCGGESLDWQVSAGVGTVYAATVVHKRGAAPYNVVLVDLDDGFRMMSRVEGLSPEEDVAVGTRVRVAVVTEESEEAGQDAPLAVFRPLEEAQA